MSSWPPGTQCPRPEPGRARPAVAHGLFGAWTLARASLPPPSTYLGGAIGAGLCARRHRLPRLWRMAAPQSVAIYKVSGCPPSRHRSSPLEPYPSKSGTSPHNLLRLDTPSLAVPPGWTTFPLEVRLSPAYQPLQQDRSSVGSGRPRSGRRAKAGTPLGKPAPRTARPLHPNPHPHRLT